MTLQGDLSSFALPDVLRLLAGTAKSGRLQVDAPMTGGEVWLRDGGIAGGAIDAAPHAQASADIVFELLRLPQGSFRFDEDEDLPEIVDAELTSVEDVLAEAEALVAEWVDVETVVPSMHAWVTFMPTIEGDEVTVTAQQWRTLAAIGNGGTVADLADALELTDLAASREVKGLVEAGLAGLREEPAYEPPITTEPVMEIEIDYVVPAEDEPFDPTALYEIIEPTAEDLDVLRSDDRPVVMESSEDALLPEPLPGEGVSYAADSVSAGNVDGRVYEAVDHPAPETHHVATADDHGPAEPGADAYEAFEMTMGAADEPAAVEAADQPAEEPGEAGEAGEAFDIPRHDFHGKGHRGITSLEEELAETDPEEEAARAAQAAMDEMAAAALAEQEQAAEDDRGSLLKFLSSVQN